MQQRAIDTGENESFWFLPETQQLLHPSLQNLHRLCGSRCAKVWPDCLVHRHNKTVAVVGVIFCLRNLKIQFDMLQLIYCRVHPCECVNAFMLMFHKRGSLHEWTAVWWSTKEKLPVTSYFQGPAALILFAVQSQQQSDPAGCVASRQTIGSISHPACLFVCPGAAMLHSASSGCRNRSHGLKLGNPWVENTDICVLESVSVHRLRSAQWCSWTLKSLAILMKDPFCQLGNT